MEFVTNETKLQTLKPELHWLHQQLLGALQSQEARLNVTHLESD